MRALPQIAAVLLALACARCSSGSSGPADSGVYPDAAEKDAAPDAAADAAAADADALPAPDAEPPDTGPPDTGIPDTGPPDMGVMPLPPVHVDVTTTRAPALLSDFHFFRWANGALEYNDRVVPYELNTALFSDYAVKSRAIWTPEGTAIQFDPQQAFDFPVGSAIVKTFLFAPDLRQPDQNLRIVETRVLLRYADGWHAFPYLWRADGSDADYFTRGRVITDTFVDPYGATRTRNYLVPQRNQCFGCHDLEDQQGTLYTTIIGPKARHLNRDHVYGGAAVNQLQHLADLGMLQGLPDLASVERDFEFSVLEATSTSALSAMELERAARDYLDINCAHCHNASATAGVTSQLFLDVYNPDLFHLGVCKRPGSAGSGTGGHEFDIVPGSPEDSILIYRTNTETPGEMMPLFSRSVRHDLGVTLLRAFVAGMPPQTCH